jgi:N-acetylmuramidase
MDREYCEGLSAKAARAETATWGKSQVMGENWSDVGWSSALHFASDMFASEGNQLKACVKFVLSKDLSQASKSHDFRERI